MSPNVYGVDVVIINNSNTILIIYKRYSKIVPSELIHALLFYKKLLQPTIIKVATNSPD